MRFDNWECVQLIKFVWWTWISTMVKLELQLWSLLIAVLSTLVTWYIKRAISSISDQPQMNVYVISHRWMSKWSVTDESVSDQALSECLKCEWSVTIWLTDVWLICCCLCLKCEWSVTVWVSEEWVISHCLSVWGVSDQSLSKVWVISHCLRCECSVTVWLTEVWLISHFLSCEWSSLSECLRCMRLVIVLVSEVWVISRCQSLS